MRPSFWPNTPDILDDHLRHAPPAAFASRFVLAATLVPLYGIYSGYELVENEPANDTTTEYRHSEKYELQGPRLPAPGLAGAAHPHRERDPPPSPGRVVAAATSGSTTPTTTASSSTAAATPTPTCCCASCSSTRTRPSTPPCASTSAPLGLPADQPYTLYDELSGDTYVWGGEAAYVRLDPPAGQVAHLLHVHR